MEQMHMYNKITIMDSFSRASRVDLIKALPNNFSHKSDSLKWTKSLENEKIKLLLRIYGVILYSDFKNLC
jgi:hypothetical protein